MKPRINIISLPASDLEKSLAFYRDCLGFPTEGIDGGIVAFELEGGLGLYLIERQEFAKYTARASLAPHVPQTDVECIMSCTVLTQEAVDDILRRAAAAGGTVPYPAKAESWGYAGYFQDPDGHLWEIVSKSDEIEPDVD